MAAQRAALQPSSRLFREAGGEAKCPQTHGVGRGLAESARTLHAQAPISLPISAPSSPISLLSAGSPHRPVLPQRMGCCGWDGSFPHCHQGPGARISTKQLAKAISLYFSFLPFNQFAEAEWILEGKEGHLGADLPRNSLCALPRLVRFEKQFNNKLYRIRNVQKCQGGCWLVSCLPLGARVTPISPVQRSWGWQGASDSSPGEDRPAHPAEVCPGAGTWVCAQVPQPPQAPWLSRRSTSCLYVRPLKVFMQV